ncbi:hypothetical protein F511_11338 [Dorcoceras hygrometricum]|uniref:Uncharacterized protein n=1 Tax=Dorcoceras hygrometricum TaxID=472368 RepID=A0A2Z7C4U2_9LAMI|nr:hypothetical protein F511_11338 [Dorcoceras hygrometricum]
MSAVVAGLLVFSFEEKADIEGIQMYPSVSSVAGVSTSSFGLVGTKSLCISGGNSVVSNVGLQLCERSDVALRTDVVDWAVKMRIRQPELETSICDVKYHVSLSTGCVLGKWVCLVTLAISLFDLQDVCIVIGSLATLDLPMVVDLIGIYVLKGPYCTLTMTNWFLQALSVIPRGSWGDVARAKHKITTQTLDFKGSRPPLSSPFGRRAPPLSRRRSPSRRRLRGWTCFDHHDEEISFVPNSSGLLVQADEGIVFPIVDLI